MNKDKVNSILLMVMCHTLILSILLMSVFGFAFSRGYYAEQFKQLELSEELRVSETDLEKSIGVLLEYLEGKRTNIDVTITKNGSYEEAFNEKEYTHMIDVLDLSLGAQRVLMVSAVITVIIFIYSWIRLKSEVFLAIALRYRTAALVWFSVFVVLGFWIATDFTSFWTTFHELFFTNDLWLLNPSTDFMIQILPEPVFMGLVFRIVGCFVTIFVALFAGSQFMISKKNKQLQKER